MRAAFIVVGSELRAWEQAETLLDYLKKVAGVRHAVICPGWNRDEKSLEHAFVYHATKAARQPFLLAYAGHGYKDERTGMTGWSYGVEHGEKQLRLSYKTLLDWIVRYREGPTLVLNDCCYSGSLLEHATGDEAGQVGLIASSVSQGYCYGDFTQSVIDTWMEGKVYEPRAYPGTLERCMVIETRSGLELDPHFFPCPKRYKLLEAEARANG